MCRSVILSCLTLLAAGLLAPAQYRYHWYHEAHRRAYPERPEELVRSWYEKFLNREPDPDGLATWAGAIRNGQPPEQVLAGLREQLRLRLIQQPRADFVELERGKLAGIAAALPRDKPADQHTSNEEQQRHVREQLSEAELTVFDLLTRPGPDLSHEEREEVKKVARQLLGRVRNALVINWRQKAQARAQVRLAIEDELDEGLPRAYSPELYQQKCSAVFEHVFETFQQADAA